MNVNDKAMLVRDMLIVNGCWAVIAPVEAGYWVTAKFSRQREAADRLTHWLDDPIVRTSLVQRSLWAWDGEGALEHVAHLLLSHRPRLGLALLLGRTWWPFDRDHALLRLAEYARTDSSGISVRNLALVRRLIEQPKNDEDEEVQSVAAEAGREFLAAGTEILSEARNTFAAAYYLAFAQFSGADERMNYCAQVDGVAPDLSHDALALAYRGPHFWVYSGEDARRLAESLPRGPLGNPTSGFTITAPVAPDYSEAAGAALQERAPGVREWIGACDNTERQNCESMDGKILEDASALANADDRWRTVFESLGDGRAR